MKNILVLIHDDAGQEARLQAALDLTRALDGHLRCVDVTPLPVPADDLVFAGGTVALLADAQACEADNRRRTEARLVAQDFSYDWIDITSTLDSALRDASAMADVIVLNPRIDENLGLPMRGLVRDVVVQTGKPVLAVPPACRELALYGHALVAWDGSAGAEAALRCAVPLLIHATQVTLVEIGDHQEGVPAQEAAVYLHRHGIRTTILPLPTQHERVTETLLAEIDALRADYLVMGGFGGNRLVEAMFGGVTRDMLADSPVPLFLAH